MNTESAYDSLPNDLRNWLNGLKSLTLREIETAEKGWQAALVARYDNTEANGAWDWWQRARNDEIAYLGEF